MDPNEMNYYQRLVARLATLPTETEWVEFKVNRADPQDVAEYISALSNSATLWEKPTAYLVWGVDDKTHDIVGTSFRYRDALKGNEELEAWLARMLNPRIDFRFHEFVMDSDKVVNVLEIPAATGMPTKVGSTAYIRVGTNKKELVGYPDKEARLWRMLDATPQEERLALPDRTADEVCNLLDYPGYYRQLGLPIPASRDKVMRDLANEGFVRANDAGSWDVTNLGALMLAVDLRQFPGLGRRAVRVIQYRGRDRIDGVQERSFARGYAFSHEEVVQFVMAIIPQEEVLEGATRHEVTSFPEVAIRELVANLMIHQDLSTRGTSLMVEVFEGRIEFTNPGSPLVPIDRILDIAPSSRNEDMASFMHKCGICEERGSGWDKIIGATSGAGLLAPRMDDQAGMFTKVTLWSRLPLAQVGKVDRVRTCYMLACLACMNSSAIGNADVRRAFGMPSERRGTAGRILADTIASGLIKPVDPHAAKKSMQYVPFWA